MRKRHPCPTTTCFLALYPSHPLPPQDPLHTHTEQRQTVYSAAGLPIRHIASYPTANIETLSQCIFDLLHTNAVHCRTGCDLLLGRCGSTNWLLDCQLATAALPVTPLPMERACSLWRQGQHRADICPNLVPHFSVLRHLTPLVAKAAFWCPNGPPTFPKQHRAQMIVHLRVFGVYRPIVRR